MKGMIVVSAAAATALTISGLSQAHHSILAYELEPIWVQGEVISFERSNPHTITTLEAQRGDGRIQRWRVEGPSISRLDGRPADLYFPQVGDVIRFCALPYKPIEELQRLWPEADFSSQPSRRIRETDETITQTVDGHIMVKPDGEKQVWDSLGVLTECMRSSGDTPQSWLDTINSEWRQAWCRQRERPAHPLDLTLRAYHDEINALLDNPCE